MTYDEVKQLAVVAVQNQVQAVRGDSPASLQLNAAIQLSECFADKRAFIAATDAAFAVARPITAETGGYTAEKIDLIASEFARLATQPS